MRRFGILAVAAGLAFILGAPASEGGPAGLNRSFDLLEDVEVAVYEHQLPPGAAVRSEGLHV